MAKRFPAHRIKSHLVYTVWEVADVLGCHRQTVIRWIRDKGLVADTDRKPWLIEGRDLKSFLGARQAQAQCKLAAHHCYCLGCKAPQAPYGKIADYIQQTPESGRLIALCSDCGSLMHKIVRRADLDTIRTKIEVTIQKANPRLASREEPVSNVTFSKEAHPDDKAQQG